MNSEGFIILYYFNDQYIGAYPAIIINRKL